MSLKTRHFYEFDAFRLDATNRLLLRDGAVVPLTPKAFDILLALVKDSGQVLQKEELMQRVWPDSFVEEASLSNHVFTLRKALGENKNGTRYIETIPRRGYRFVAEVAEISDDGADSIVREHAVSHITSEQTEETNLDVQVWQLKLDPRFDSLRADGRFTALLSRLNL
jgi:DNA-binding winged helix-turn-helix (wHTH) protein